MKLPKINCHMTFHANTQKCYSHRSWDRLLGYPCLRFQGVTLALPSEPAKEATTVICWYRWSHYKHQIFSAVHTLWNWANRIFALRMHLFAVLVTATRGLNKITVHRWNQGRTIGIKACLILLYHRNNSSYLLPIQNFMKVNIPNLCKENIVVKLVVYIPDKTDSSVVVSSASRWHNIG